VIISANTSYVRSTSAHRFKVSNVTNTVQYTNKYIHVYGPTDM